MSEALHYVITTSGTDIVASCACTGDRKQNKVSADKYTVYSPMDAIKKLLVKSARLYGSIGQIVYS